MALKIRKPFSIINVIHHWNLSVWKVSYYHFLNNACEAAKPIFIAMDWEFIEVDTTNFLEFNSVRN